MSSLGPCCWSFQHLIAVDHGICLVSVWNCCVCFLLSMCCCSQCRGYQAGMSLSAPWAVRVVSPDI
jgi:hypothetical protein